MEVIEIKTTKREEFVEITPQLQELIRFKQWHHGVLFVFCPHTTGGITINEAADPSVVRDILANLRQLIPQRGNYEHLEGNSDAHIKSSLIGCSEHVLVRNGKLILGTWQGVFFTEFDGPRRRKIHLSWLRS